MLTVKNFLSFCAEEWLLTFSVMGVAISSLYLHQVPSVQPEQLIPIFLLLTLFVAVKGVEQSGFLSTVSQLLERGSFQAPRLVLLSFVLSIFLSIDVTLVTILPIILTMRVRERNTLVLLAAFSAHTGAALTPFGTPQNLFIFSFYHLEVDQFIQAIAPFSLGMTALFFLASFFVRISIEEEREKDTKETISIFQGITSLLLLFVVVLSVLKVFPWYAAFVVLLYAITGNRKMLRVDYPLLLTFVLFLLLANNMKILLSHLLEHPVHIFLLSSLMSQFISNVPTTLLLHQFTSQWEALLWGTNVGGFGTLVAALANLIAYRIYVSYEGKESGRLFLKQMMLWGAVVYIVGLLLYFSLYSVGWGGLI
jgi:Na+/H+ antiporter NhaD/arsenite permease-like protein